MTTTLKSEPRQAEILREYGPYPGMDHIHGVTFDGAHVWFARGESIVALDPESGRLVRELWQLADDRIRKVEGTLWVGEDHARKVHQIDAEKGAILHTIESNRFVTGVSWVNGELWHGTMEARAERAPPHRSGDGRSPRATRDARRCRRERARGRRHRHDLFGHQVVAQATRTDRIDAFHRKRRTRPWQQPTILPRDEWTET